MPEDIAITVNAFKQQPRKEKLPKATTTSQNFSKQTSERKVKI